MLRPLLFLVCGSQHVITFNIDGLFSPPYHYRSLVSSYIIPKISPTFSIKPCLLPRHTSASVILGNSFHSCEYSNTDGKDEMSNIGAMVEVYMKVLVPSFETHPSPNMDNEICQSCRMVGYCVVAGWFIYDRCGPQGPLAHSGLALDVGGNSDTKVDGETPLGSQYATEVNFIIYKHSICCYHIPSNWCTSPLFVQHQLNGWIFATSSQSLYWIKERFVLPIPTSAEYRFVWHDHQWSVEFNF